MNISYRTENRKDNKPRMRRENSGLNTLALAAMLLVVWIAATFSRTAYAQERPNVVMLVSEDNSAHYMEHFTQGGARTPNLDALAEAGITFDRVFSNAPVCSVSRTTLINGVYAPRTATHHHRPIEHVDMPNGWEMFPHYLREEGYYTVIDGKKDFNMIEGDVWDEEGGQAHWSSRPDGDTPFFYMEQIGTDTHESKLHFDRQTFRTQPTKHDPDKVEVFPYLPDTDLIRYTHAYYLDRHRDLDEKIGQRLNELEEDGLREETIIIYFGDHGGALPRSKGYVYESGVHVPMVVYVPEKFQHLSPFEPGSRVQGFVEFVDIGPTVLNLAGAGLPAHMDGKPFLGQDVTAKQVAERDEAFSYANRFDQKYDMVRALRKGKYKYIRSYWSHYPNSLNNRYRFLQLAYQQWKELYEAGKLNETQRHFFEPRQPEALYDLEADPHETKNLAGNPEYADVLKDMRGRLRQRMRSMPDLALFPESFLLDHAVQDPLSFAQQNTTRITQLLNVADLSLLPFDEARADLKVALEADDPWKRYWALIVCSVFGEKAAEFESRARALATDKNVPVRVRAAEFLGVLGAEDPISILYGTVGAATNEADVLLALNTMTYLRDHLGYEVDPERLDPDIESRQIGIRLKHLGATR